ncbi:MAG TPA: hypothetical protein VGN13_05530 [Solirubrobacteraceae bacterium]|jgi:hypothetical protein
MAAEARELSGLPRSWLLAVRVCPWCADRPGQVVGEGGVLRDCYHCDGTGDLLGQMLLDAYRRGRNHVLERMREVEDARAFAQKRVLEEEPDVRSLKRSLGL